MPKLRSATSTQGRNMAGARALWRATGVKEQDFGKPIIAVVNSFTQFVPGHVHLRDMGKLVAEQIEAAGAPEAGLSVRRENEGVAAVVTATHPGVERAISPRQLELWTTLTEQFEASFECRTKADSITLTWRFPPG